MTTGSGNGHCGGDFIVEFLEQNTSDHVFGLPGSSSVSMFNGLARTGIKLVPSLQENAAVAMADGHARFAGPTGVLLYMLPGTATALSNLYNAWRDETPLVVIVSQLDSSGRRGQAHVGEADLAELARPFTQFAREITAVEQLPDALNSAYQAACGPPAGPAVLVVTEDVLLADAPNYVPSPRGYSAPVTPVEIRPVVDRLIEAERPLLVVGGQVRRSGGSEIVERLATELGLPIMYEPFWNDRLGVSPSHENVIGQLTEGTSFASEADLVLALGCRLFNEVHPRPDPWFPNAFIVHVNEDAEKVGQVVSPSWSSAANVGSFARCLLESIRLSGLPNPERLNRRYERIRRARVRRQHPRPGPFTDVASVLSQELEFGYLVDESVSANFPIMSALSSDRGDRYVSTTGGSLGWGIGAACGVALATGDPVTCVVGDGAFFFGCQALWPIVAENLPVTIVALDNGGFGSTMYFEDEFVRSHRSASPTRYLGSDFRANGPSLVDVARGFGMDAHTVRPEELPARLAAVRSVAPALLRVPIGVDDYSTDEAAGS